jgi:ABC-2 type transport system ATP-binding protein
MESYEPVYAIDVRGLTKSFGKNTAVDHIDIRVKKGAICGFLGPNGSGKTTTLRMLCGLLTPDAGKGVCLGEDILNQGAAIKRKIGYMTQRFSFWEDMTIAENLKFTADLYQLSNPGKRVNQALEELGLTKRSKQMAGQLSGGWKQRLALAACTMHDPELLLLDEPTAGVDPQARREFWDEIHRLACKGITILVSTHYMDEVGRCHAIIYMHRGKIVTSGTVEEVTQGAELTSWIARGKDIMDLKEDLEKIPAIRSVAPFGDNLHISGTDPEALEDAIALFKNKDGYEWVKATPSFEDIFIRYMNVDNAQVEGQGNV